MLIALSLGLPKPYRLIQLLLLALLLDLVLANRRNGGLKLLNLLVFECIVRVFGVELLNELAQVFFLLLHIDVVALQVFVLLLGKHAMQFLVQVLDDLVH